MTCSSHTTDQGQNTKTTQHKQKMANAISILLCAEAEENIYDKAKDKQAAL